MPSNLAIGNAVELLLDICREVIVDNRGKLRLKVVVNDHTDVGRCKAVLLLAVALRGLLRGNLTIQEYHLLKVTALSITILLYDIASVDNRGDCRRIGRRTTDAKLLKALNEGCLIIARGCLCIALCCSNLRSYELVANHHLGQDTALALLLSILIDSLRVQAHKAIEAYYLAHSRKLLLTPFEVDDDICAVKLCGHHLRCHSALPDKVVEALLGRCTLNLVALDIRRTNSLVSLLSTLRLSLEVVGIGVFSAKEAGNLVLALCNGHLREVYRVGTHIGDKTLLIELLRYGHRLRHAHTQLTASLLLECRGGKRRCCIALHGLLLGLRHGELLGDAVVEELLGILTLLEGVRKCCLEECSVLVTSDIELSHNTILSNGLKADNLPLALNNKADSHRLNTAGRECRAHLLPQHGR